MTPLTIIPITIYFFQNKTSQIYAEKNKDDITITIPYIILREPIYIKI